MSQTQVNGLQIDLAELPHYGCQFLKNFCVQISSEVTFFFLIDKPFEECSISRVESNYGSVTVKQIKGLIRISQITTVR